MQNHFYLTFCRSLRDYCLLPFYNSYTNNYNIKSAAFAWHFQLAFRQKHLEDGLLKAGRFKDALQVLLDWLYKVEPNLNENLPVHGDVDTVNMLVEHHKVGIE